MLGEGSILANRYRLIREIGRGGMGSVWQAEQIEWRAPVAVKLMAASMTDNPEALARFRREARVAAGLRSPHVVQLLDHGVDSASRAPFLVMELLEGESLADRIRRGGPLSRRETACVLTHVGRALSRAHDAGVVHRDLKPDNIFLVPNEEEFVAKVLDFGVAKWGVTGEATGITRPGSVMGTPSYMSPEQLRGCTELDSRSDLWSLAVIACECLTARRVFDSPDFAELTLSICEGRSRPRPSQLGSVPDGFDQWFERAAAIPKESRFATAREQMESLQRLCGVDARLKPASARRQTVKSDGRTRTAISVSPVSRSSGRGDTPARPRARRVVASAVAVAMALVGVVAFWLVRRPEGDGGVRSSGVERGAMVAPPSAAALSVGVDLPERVAPVATSEPELQQSERTAVGALLPRPSVSPRPVVPGSEEGEATAGESADVASARSEGASRALAEDVESRAASKSSKRSSKSANRSSRRKGRTARAKARRRKKRRKKGEGTPPRARAVSETAAESKLKEKKPALRVQGRRIRTTL